jgi:hypothetical protein|tara:strand:- start:118 stop:381 length:264 start_codon:yes stop_codon:yes gene_type:complete
MGDGGEDGMGPPDLAAPDGMVSSGRIKWAPTATLGVQFFRCGGGDKRGEMYAGDAGSAIDSDQTGMRIIGYTGWVCAEHTCNIPPIP